MLDVKPISAFSDNYIWCLIDQNNQQAVVVDPGDATPVEAFLQTHQLQLVGILITHHHRDHIGGLQALLNKHAVPVYGPQNPAIEAITTRLREGETIDVLGHSFRIFETPGHTLDHIAYYNEELAALFCGDTLFSGGCGRLFEGTAAMMLESLDKLCGLPDNTRVFCAHEYTQANLNFAEQVEPDSVDLQQRINEVKALRQQQQPSVPSTLSVEKLTNPFLRSDQIAVIESAIRQGCSDSSSRSEIFATIRHWKDNF